MTDHPVMPGCEPYSHEGGPVGVLVVHGFTGSPGTMRPLAEAVAAAGHTVELPRLPGHGTHVDDMVPTRFEDWFAAAEAAYLELAGRSESVVVVGLSMGGTLTCRLAGRHPEIAGIVCINPLVQPPEPAVVELTTMMIDAGEVLAPGVGSDIAAPGVVEPAYEQAPLAPVLSLFEALRTLEDDLRRITCPLLLMTSPDDHVVHPDNSDHLAAVVGGPVERVTLARSFHVATLDHDKDEIAARTVEFVAKVTA